MQVRKSKTLLTLAAGLVLTAGAWTSARAQTLDPASVTQTLRPGGAFDVSKNVTTPPIPPRPDICFFADTTGSMGTAITNVRNNATMIMNLVRAVQPDSQFCAAQYRDTFDTPQFQVDQTVTATTLDVQNAINTWAAGGGGDTPEGQLHGLTELVTAAGFRAGSTRIVVWFGDASGHDPSIGGETLASTIAALVGEDVRVIAIPVITGSGDGLDATGQATAITSATGGVLLAGANPNQVTNAIIAGLTNLPVTVSMASDCAAVTGGAITTTFVPASQTITSGGTATFTETIHVSLGAVQGQTYVCRDHALLNGSPMLDAEGNLVVETKTITVEDVTAPSARCVQGVNPAGQIPAAGNNPKSGQNPDGFYQLLASDNVGVASVQVCDSGSSFCSDPFLPNDYVKITQAQGATPGDKRPGPGVLASHLTLTGDAILSVTDGAGNVTTVACLVPPPPK
ncbi:MAG TPA: vWA domain-containing protein [Vicinamibacterales bacterium]